MVFVIAIVFVLILWIWDWCVGTIYSFVLTSAWGWRYIDKTCRRVHVYV